MIPFFFELYSSSKTFSKNFVNVVDNHKSVRINFFHNINNFCPFSYRALRNSLHYQFSGALRIECGLDDDPATADNMKVMPAALLTYDRFWLSDTQPDILKDYYGLTGTSLCDNLRLFRATAPVTP